MVHRNDIGNIETRQDEYGLGAETPPATRFGRFIEARAFTRLPPSSATLHMLGGVGAGPQRSWLPDLGDGRRYDFSRILTVCLLFRDAVRQVAQSIKLGEEPSNVALPIAPEIESTLPMSRVMVQRWIDGCRNRLE